MARPQGRVVERDGQRGTTFAIRFMAGNKRRFQTLGTTEQGWTRARAQTELQNALADVRRGIWQPPTPQTEPTLASSSDPSFHEFASEWFDDHKDEWREGTRLDYGHHLSDHLLPFFKSHRLSQITIAEVDRYRSAKVKQVKIREVKRGKKAEKVEVKLSAATINKTITRLAQILELAVEYGHIPANPAKGQRRRLKAVKPSPVWLDSAGQIQALLDAAGELDRELKTRTPRRAILSTLVFSGLRIGEMAELRWRDVDLAGGTITVRASKTDAGVRRVELLPALARELAAHRANTGTLTNVRSLAAHRSRTTTPIVNAHPDGRVFATSTGRAMNPSNIRNRVLSPAVKRAGKRLVKAGLVPLPEGLTPHKLRHTYTSLLAALGTDPGAMMDLLGHTDPGFTLRVYRHSMRRDPESRAQLRALVGVEIPGTGEVSGTISGTNGRNERVTSAVGSNGR